MPPLVMTFLLVLHLNAKGNVVMASRPMRDRATCEAEVEKLKHKVEATYATFGCVPIIQHFKPAKTS